MYFMVVWYNWLYRGVAQLVARSVWDAEVACSSQVAPTMEKIVKIRYNIKLLVGLQVVF